MLDVALALFLAFVVVGDTLQNPNRWELIGGLAVVAGSVATARKYPAVSFGIAMVGALAVPFPYGHRVPVWTVFVLVAMGYLGGLRMAKARPALLTAGAVIVGGLPPALIVGPDGVGDWAAMLAILLFGAISPWLLGRYVRMRGEMARTGWRRAEEMESRQRLVADQARLRERARIAGDMHDSLGHELSLLAVRAAAMEVASGLDEKQRAAAGELRSGAAAATGRLREIIGVLREDDTAPTAPVQGDLPGLIARARDSGLLIESTVDETPIPPMVARAAYRVVQESLTNVAKHAPGASVRICVSTEDDHTEVSVVNVRPPAGPLPGAASGRRGLIGLHERVRLVGGTLRAGPRDGGFAVTASLPHAAAPVQDTDESWAVAGIGPSTSARALELARRDVRRSLIVAIAVPLGLFATIVAVGGIVFAVQWYSSELDADTYSRLHVGQPREEIAALLPSHQRLSRPDRGEPFVPLGARCEYYGTGRSFLNSDLAAYRLCFAGGRLVEKVEYEEGTR